MTAVISFAEISAFNFRK